MSYRYYNYTPVYYSSVPRTVRRDYVTTTTERRYGGPLSEYNYTYEISTKPARPSTISYDYPDYYFSYLPEEGPLSEYNYTYETTTKRVHPSTILYDFPDYRSTITTTKVGPYGVTTRTYRY